MANTSEINNTPAKAALLAGAMAFATPLDASNPGAELSLLKAPAITRIDSDAMLRYASFQNPAKSQQNQDPKATRMLAHLDDYSASYIRFIEQCLALIKDNNPAPAYAITNLDPIALAKKIAVLEDLNVRPLAPSFPKSLGLGKAPSFVKDVPLSLLGNFQQSQTARDIVSQKLIAALPVELQVLVLNGMAEITIQLQRDINPYRGMLGMQFFRSEGYRYNLFKFEKGKLIDIRGQATPPTEREYQPKLMNSVIYSNIAFGYDEFSRVYGKPFVTGTISVKCNGETLQGQIRIEASGEVELKHQIERKIGLNNHAMFPPGFLTVPQPGDQIDSLAAFVSTGKYIISLPAALSEEQLSRWKEFLFKSSNIITADALRVLEASASSSGSALSQEIRKCQLAADGFELYLKDAVGGDEREFSRILEPEGLGHSRASLPRPSALMDKLRESQNNNDKIEWLQTAKVQYERRMTSLRARCQKF